MSITNIREKIKPLLQTLKKRDIVILICIIFTAISSFLLGKVSHILDTKEPVRLELLDNVGESTPLIIPPSNTILPTGKTVSLASTSAQTGMYVGSKTGTKYHLPWCSGALRISDANKVWFASKAEAEKAGYTPAGNCKGI